MRKRGPVEKANREKSWREHLKKLSALENPIRFVTALPPDIDLQDISWKPTEQEKAWMRLAEIDREYDQAHIRALERKLAAYAAIIARDFRSNLITHLNSSAR